MAPSHLDHLATSPRGPPLSSPQGGPPGLGEPGQVQACSSDCQRFSFQPETRPFSYDCSVCRSRARRQGRLPSREETSPSIHWSAIHSFINLSTHLPFCREILGVLWCAQQGPAVATWWRLVLRPGVKDVVGVGVTTAAAIPPREDPRVCSPMSGSCCPGSSKD